jgi:hypothetical protein
MALLIIGTETQELGRVGDLQCSVCDSKRAFEAAARYNYFEVGMLGVSGFTQYSIMCAACRTSWGLDAGQAKAYRKEGLLPSPDVPPLRRFGLAIALLLIVMAVALNRFGPLVTAGSILAVAAVFVLPGVIKGVRRKGLKGYTKEAVSADKPVSLFESVGGLPAGREVKRELFNKCPSCGLNNAPTDAQCERCGASLAARRTSATT